MDTSSEKDPGSEAVLCPCTISESCPTMQNAVDMTIRAHEQAVCIPENPRAAQLPVHTRPAGRARISLLSQVLYNSVYRLCPRYRSLSAFCAAIQSQSGHLDCKYSSA